MKFRKTKRFHTVESYAACMCGLASCSCDCSGYICACQPAALVTSDRLDAQDNSKTYNHNGDFAINMSSQRVQLG